MTTPLVSRALLAGWMCLATTGAAFGQGDPLPAPTVRSVVRRPPPAAYEAPDLRALAPRGANDLRDVIERFEDDFGALTRFFATQGSPARERVLRQFYGAWLAGVERIDFDALGPDAKIDWVLFRNTLKHRSRELVLARARVDEIASLLPFAPNVMELKEARQLVTPLDAQKAAATLIDLGKQVEQAARKLRAPDAPKMKSTVASRASQSAQSLRQTLKDWFGFYNGYDPAFTWWAAEPYKQLDKGLEAYAGALREKGAGIRQGDRDTIVGDPIGREALLSELEAEMIPYTPEELIALANKEFAWCQAEMLKASRDLGYGDDWRKALGHVKNLYVPAGQQPALILEQALEAIEYVQKHNLVTVPPLARDTWRMEMMTPERQRINPFFTGGEVISVSYPTDGMSHEQKLMSMRGNNIHFSRATVFHELIPGHHLQGYMTRRHRPYRSLFRTPFWGEGWALHWEMLFWDLGFQQSPENRIGMLFWRSHRAARIIFSLSFHLEKMTAQECVDLLVDKVGHERENAAAEVRRSFEGRYSPLYQAAYMLGALQFRALHKELAGTGKMTNRDFHDAILKLNTMPVAMVRASLTQEKVTRDFTSSWKFYGDLSAAR
ncbi:MAG: DUF885 family protein [Bryobacteraceae bacterium]